MNYVNTFSKLFRSRNDTRGFHNFSKMNNANTFSELKWIERILWHFQDELRFFLRWTDSWFWLFSKTPKSWTMIWKREKIISYRNNLISWNQFYEKYREINFILEVVFIKLISGKKFVKSIFHSILPDNATFPKWISDYVDQNVMAHSSLSFSQNFGLRHSWNDWIILQHVSFGWTVITTVITLT